MRLEKEESAKKGRGAIIVVLSTIDDSTTITNNGALVYNTATMVIRHARSASTGAMEMAAHRYLFALYIESILCRSEIQITAAGIVIQPLSLSAVTAVRRGALAACSSVLVG